MELKYSEIYTTYVPSGVWVWCLLEMVGLLDSSIHVYLGRVLVVCFPLYLSTRGNSREVSPVKRQMFNQMLSVMSDEIKKLGVEHDDEIHEKDAYIHDRISMLQTEISENINTLRKTTPSPPPPEHPKCERCVAMCILCSAGGDTILECMDGFNHWWQCDVCNRDVEDPPIMHVHTNGHTGPKLRHRGRSRTKRPVRIDRSRSRDREDEYEDHRLIQTEEQRNCEHVLYTHVFGMYDKCKKCNKCGLEVF
jgi:hypothetical protein